MNYCKHFRQFLFFQIDINRIFVILSDISAIPSISVSISVVEIRYNFIEVIDAV